MGEEHAVFRDIGAAVLSVDQRSAQRHVELGQCGSVVGEQLRADLIEVFPTEAQVGDVFVPEAFHSRADDAVRQSGVEDAQVRHESDIGR